MVCRAYEPNLIVQSERPSRAPLDSLSADVLIVTQVLFQPTLPVGRGLQNQGFHGIET